MARSLRSLAQAALLIACGTAVSAASIGAGGAMRVGVQNRLRGGSAGSGGYKAVRLGYPVNSDDDPNEPFMYLDPHSPEGNAFADSEETAELYDPDWATARRKIGDIIEKRQERAEALRLRGGSTQAAKAGAVPVSLEVSVLHIKPIGSPPVKVVVCGDGPELGEWDIAKGITMECPETTGFKAGKLGKDEFPIHKTTVNLPAGKTVEYKYAVVRAEPGDGIPLQWEAQNRQLEVPKTGTALIKNEFVENRDTDPRITDEPFQCNAQEWARWYKHHVGPLSEIGPGREG